MMGIRNVNNQVCRVRCADRVLKNDPPLWSAQRTLRTGFSMIELLVVIGIIVALAAMLFSVLGRTMENARIKATRVTIMKINTILQQQRKEFDHAEKVNQTFPQKETFGGFGARADLEHYYARKLRMKQAFPQRFEDFLGPDGVPGSFQRWNLSVTRIDDDGNSDPDWEALTFNGVTVSRPDLDELGLNIGSSFSDDPVVGRLIAKSLAEAFPDKDGWKLKHDPKTESAELLYYTITKNSFGFTTADDGEFSAREIADTDGDGLLEFVDAWGEPLRFYRWPTRLIRPGGPGTTVTNRYWNMLASRRLDDLEKNRDPYDVNAKMYNTIFNYARLNNNGDMSLYFHEGDANFDLTGDTNFIQAAFHTPKTFHTFLVISTGPDLELGLLEPTDTVRFGHLAQPDPTITDVEDGPLNDNVTNLKSEEK